MIPGNLCLVAASAIMGEALLRQARRDCRGMPCSPIWGALYLVLFLVLPLVSNLVTGPARSVRGGLITEDHVYLVYGLISLAVAVAYAALVRIAGGPGPDEPDADVPVARPGPVALVTHHVVGLVVVAGFFTFVRGTGMSLAELMVASRFAWFASDTMQGGMVNLGLYMMGLVAVFTFFDVKHGVRSRLLSVLVYGTILLMVFVTGGRKWLLFVASGAVAGYYDRRGGRLPAGPRLAGGAILVGLAAFAWQFGRTVAWDTAPSAGDLVRQFAAEVPRLFNEGDATYFYRASLDAIRLNMDAHLLYPLALVRRILFLPLPDEWTFGLKPPGLPILFANELDLGNALRQGNFPPGLVGAAVLSFGWWATPPVLAAATFFGMAACDRWVARARSLLRDGAFATFGAAAILLMRGSTGGLNFLVFNLVVLALAAAAAATALAGLAALAARRPDHREETS